MFNGVRMRGLLVLVLSIQLAGCSGFSMSPMYGDVWGLGMRFTSVKPQQQQVEQEPVADASSPVSSKTRNTTILVFAALGLVVAGGLVYFVATGGDEEGEISPCGPGMCYVRSYVRQDGTRVDAYCRRC